ncbi:hypothetical protein M427DRAFT_73125 [Gonapodya prolifera JEL478]|uniref:FCP1 homology domain-containing protein n=1 Tax=Gonapodya prolifera (strain JEL478) TaxID=1344416 RepID=A0A139A2X4_GONPJ|nr:hypothetical protein M427DRAFT_73125 [Gonapodya prolifera JEL478]|eukprot:KXS11146.1 hypothetical protein M427DRAFT_73125 [Gonapodya prolifera JEL478]
MANADPNATSLVDTGRSHAVPPDTTRTDARADILAVLDRNGTLLDHPIYLRPPLVPFLGFLFANFHVVVWTSATAKNARALVEGALPPHLLSEPKFLWDRSKCDVVGSGKDEESMKDLEKIWKKHQKWNEGVPETDIVLPRVAAYLHDLSAWIDVKSLHGESTDVREWIGGTPFGALAVRALDDPSFSNLLSALPTNLFLGHVITTDDQGKVVRKTRTAVRHDQSFDATMQKKARKVGTVGKPVDDVGSGEGEDEFDGKRKDREGDDDDGQDAKRQKIDVSEG